MGEFFKETLISKQTDKNDPKHSKYLPKRGQANIEFASKAD